MQLGKRQQGDAVRYAAGDFLGLGIGIETGRGPIHDPTGVGDPVCFSVHLDRQGFHCFRCHAQGNQLDLWRQVHQRPLFPAWEAITAQGAVATNYQLMPGDRVFIAENQMIALDTGLAQLLAPIERVMGFSTLGVTTVSRFSGKVLAGGGMRGFFGGQ